MRKAGRPRPPDGVDLGAPRPAVRRHPVPGPDRGRCPPRHRRTGAARCRARGPALDGSDPPSGGDCPEDGHVQCHGGRPRRRRRTPWIPSDRGELASATVQPDRRPTGHHGAGTGPARRATAPSCPPATDDSHLAAH